jgi:purine-binding chemotaxis protein CheW
VRLLTFTLDDLRIGVDADAVVEVVRAVAITPLPNAPAVVEGMIDVRGTVVPVFDLRRRFGLPGRELDPEQQFVLVRAGSRTAALHVDRALDLVDVDASALAPINARTTANTMEGVVTSSDGLTYVHDVDAFLSAAESESLSAALAAPTTRIA